jgi:hypothetical protein
MKTEQFTFRNKGSEYWRAQAAKKCEGKSRDEIAEILGAALNRVAPLKPFYSKKITN